MSTRFRNKKGHNSEERKGLAHNVEIQLATALEAIGGITTVTNGTIAKLAVGKEALYGTGKPGDKKRKAVRNRVSKWRAKSIAAYIKDLEALSVEPASQTLIAFYAEKEATEEAAAEEAATAEEVELNCDLNFEPTEATHIETPATEDIQEPSVDTDTTAPTPSADLFSPIKSKKMNGYPADFDEGRCGKFSVATMVMIFAST